MPIPIRPNTGAMQFEGDWPGLFIRGDSAIMLAASIRRVMSHIAANADSDVMSAVARLANLKVLIETTVMVAPADQPGKPACKMPALKKGKK